MTDPGRQLYAQDVVRRVLALREDLVRHDENLKAWQLLKAAPYFVTDDPAISVARREQYAMVKHVLPPEELSDEDREADPYEAYYRDNPHERSFEEMYGVGVNEAHRLPRVRYLHNCLTRQADAAGIAAVDMRAIDLSANDGWMAAYFSAYGFSIDCMDLHPGNCELAERRREQYPRMGQVVCADLHDAAKHFEPYSYDAVVAFETVEHVADPDAMMDAMHQMASRDGRLYVSTPLEAVEQGNLDSWDLVEPKGHVRVFREQDFRELLRRHGSIERFEIGPDRVMFAQLAPRD